MKASNARALSPMCRWCLKKASEVACLLRGGHMTVALQGESREPFIIQSSIMPTWTLRYACVCSLDAGKCAFGIVPQDGRQH